MKTLEYRTDYSTVVAGWRSMVAGTYKGQTAAVRTQTGLWREKPGWVGASIPQMTGYVDDGYLVDGMTVKRGAYARPRRKMRFSEEGELQVDLALSGHDTPFLNWGKRTRQQGLTVDVELAVRAGTPAAVLRDYAKWVAGLIYGFEAKGYALNVNVVSRCKNLGVNKEAADTFVRVSSANRRSDFKTWSAILSPGGFRMLIFTARILNCAHNGVRANPGMGGSYGPAWGVAWDPKQRHLTIRCAATSERFPVEQMDQQLAAVKF